nr:dedicator of cytokinesis protein 3-like isoform X2 [Monopterus albus]XP_020467854.1 dedicator of cytokinesis protein 3-like isoform X2 [Monopterus albus]
MRKPNVKGVFPASYVHLKKAIITNRGPHETAVPLEDPVVTEVTSMLQEWASLWKQLYVKHKVDLFYKVRHVMMELIDLRRQLLSGHLTQDQSRDVKRHITVRLDWGNEHLGLDLVPRKEFEMVDEDQISVSDLYKMHLSSRHSVQQSTTQGDGTWQRHGEASRVPVPSLPGFNSSLKLGATVAQKVEWSSPNQKVGGSIPILPSPHVKCP